MRLPAQSIFGVTLLLALAACENGSPNGPTPPTPCTYTLSSTSLTFLPAGGTATIGVTAPAHCTWTAASDRDWLTVTSGANGTGNGQVVVAASANPTTVVRTGSLTIGGQVVTVREDGLAPCSVTLAPAGATYGPNGGTGNLTVSSPSHCAWTAVSNAPWLVVTAGAQGLGNGLVSYAVDRNREPETRTAAIAVNERTFVVTQTGEAVQCDYSVTPVTFTPCMSASGDLTAMVSTQQTCSWTAAPNASWISVIDGESGNGPGLITFRVTDNWEAPRQGVVMVRWPTVTEGQNLQVQQAGCYYGVSTSAIAVDVAGGAAKFDVVQQSDPQLCGGPLQNACVWTAISNVPWITVTTPMPQKGDNPVSFVVLPNDGVAPRTGTITVRNQVVRITQAGR